MRRILFLLVFVPTVILRMGWLISRFLISWALRGTVFVFFYLLMAVAAAITLCMVVSYVLLTACGSHLRFPY
ncbi:MAG: hypothetical protein D6B25_04120 [Desulfobulbaceae bacterium]|nr:MAG: hypothetical protein D6B25_04120 [Desulfobulbaceae bacterium]